MARYCERVDGLKKTKTGVSAVASQIGFGALCSDVQEVAENNDKHT
jgi:hypothetical protein